MNIALTLLKTLAWYHHRKQKKCMQDATSLLYCTDNPRAFYELNCEGEIQGMYNWRFVCVKYDTLLYAYNIWKQKDEPDFNDMLRRYKVNGADIEFDQFMQFLQEISLSESQEIKTIHEEYCHQKDIAGTFTANLINALLWHYRFVCSYISFLEATNEVDYDRESLVESAFTLLSRTRVLEGFVAGTIEATYKMRMPAKDLEPYGVEVVKTYEAIKDIQDIDKKIKNLLNDSALFKIALSENIVGEVEEKINVIRKLAERTEDKCFMTLLELFWALMSIDENLYMSTMWVLRNLPLDYWKNVIGLIKTSTMPLEKTMMAGLRIWSSSGGCFYDPYAAIAFNKPFYRSLENHIENKPYGEMYRIKHATMNYVLRCMIEKDFKDIKDKHEFFIAWNPMLKANRSEVELLLSIGERYHIKWQDNRHNIDNNFHLIFQAWKRELEAIQLEAKARNELSFHILKQYLHMWYLHGT